MRLACLLLTVPVLIGAQGVRAVPDLSRHLPGLDGTFVLLNGTTGEYIRHNPARAAQRFAPCSTFKIPHTAILLESGAAPDPTFTLKYDPGLNQPRNWARDFNLRDAFKASALWYYQALARQLGMPTEDRLLRQFQYGKTDTTGGLGETGNPYWVDGSLRISANEQVDFLKRFYEGRLGVSPRTTTLTKDIILAEQTPSWRLSAKTGACQPSGLETANWYVGYVEKADAVYYFALEIGAKDYGRAFSERIPISRAILTELWILN